MSRQLLWFAVPVIAVAALFGVGSLLASSRNDTVPEVIEPAAGEVGFPTATLTDEQGAVSVAVTQLNLNGPGDTLDFAVAMDTHSVELDMDLTQTATLTTDTGLALSPSRWDAPSGGHHVSGTLSFVALADDVAVLDGATQLTLTLRDIDAPERVFTWEQEITE